MAMRYGDKGCFTLFFSSSSWLLIFRRFSDIYSIYLVGRGEEERESGFLLSLLAGRALHVFFIFM